MKKFTIILAAALVSFSAMAQHTLNNPVGADGRYIVKYDCANDQFAASNDMEVDETFTFAVDVTGTWLEDFLKGTPAAEGASRALAINKWTSKGDVNGETNRMKQIKGNIYGMTVNYAQIFGNKDVLASDVLQADSILYIYGQIFGFEYTADDPGAGWWMWETQNVDVTKAPGSDCLFAFLPYTGTKTCPEFYADDFEEGIYGSDQMGFAAPCVDAPTAVENVEVKQQGAKFIENGQMYILHNGVKYNALGAQVK